MSLELNEKAKKYRPARFKFHYLTFVDSAKAFDIVRHDIGKDSAEFEVALFGLQPFALAPDDPICSLKPIKLNEDGTLTVSIEVDFSVYASEDEAYIDDISFECFSPDSTKDDVIVYEFKYPELLERIDEILSEYVQDNGCEYYQDRLEAQGDALYDRWKEGY